MIVQDAHRPVAKRQPLDPHANIIGGVFNAYHRSSRLKISWLWMYNSYYEILPYSLTLTYYVGLKIRILPRINRFISPNMAAEAKSLLEYGILRDPYC